MPVLRSFGSSYTESSDGPSVSSSRRIAKKMDILDQKIDGLYKDVYVSRPDNRNNLDMVLDKIDNAINSIQDYDVSVSGMSELLRRIDQSQGSSVNKLMSSVSELFEDENIMATLIANQEVNREISAQNYQYDMICRYLPKLVDALEIKRDNVLCSDNFEKRFINPKSNRTNKIELAKFASNVSKIEEEYHISEFIEKTYMNVSKYGEDFIYVVPYNVAIERIIRRSNRRKSGIKATNGFTFYESANYHKEELLKESYGETEEFKNYRVEAEVNKDISFSGMPINLYFNDSVIIEELIQDYSIVNESADLRKFKSMTQCFLESNLNEAGNVSGSLSKQMEDVIKQNDKLSYAASKDGLIIPGDLVQDPDKIDKKMLGAVLERLPRENIIPVYIGKKCIGYYYLQFKEFSGKCGFCGGHHMTPGVSNAAKYSQDMNDEQQEMAIRFIANRMSQAMDTHFINANKDLKEEIYNVLRYNEKFNIEKSNDIGITFIPAEDIIHCYFEFDEESHRGISDLEKSIVPSMLYILLYLTDIIGKITRSSDKRIYYVKQNVETNVARTMMNVVQQIKKGNMGMRQIESMNNILNIVGKYNDFIIPLGQSGDPPVQFEVMNGQNIETPTDIMDKMEEAAVNGTGTPFEFLNSTYQQDFAIRFSMTNSRFLKTIQTRQRKTENFISPIYTRVYNYEFDEKYSLILVTLPPPIYLSMNNNQQLIDNVNQQADKIIETELSDESDELKAEFKKVYVRDTLSTYINFDQIERLKNIAKVNLEAKKEAGVESSSDSSSGENMNDYM